MKLLSKRLLTEQIMPGSQGFKLRNKKGQSHNFNENLSSSNESENLLFKVEPSMETEIGRVAREEQISDLFENTLPGHILMPETVHTR